MIDREKLNRELFIACKHGLVNAASMLIEAGADVNHVPPNVVQLRGIEGWACLHEAVDRSQPEIVQLLIIQGALMEKDGDGNTPLDSAIEAKNKDIIRILMNHEGGI